MLTEDHKKWLMAVVSCDDAAVIKILNGNCELANWQSNIDGNTALHYAAKFGNCSLIRLLAGDHKVDVNRKNFAGLTPLHLAALCTQSDAILLLTSTYSADQMVRDHRGQCPVTYLPENQNGQLLKKRFKDPKTTLMESNHKAIFKLLSTSEQPDVEAAVIGGYFPWQSSGDSRKDPTKSSPNQLVSASKKDRKLYPIIARHADHEIRQPDEAQRQAALLQEHKSLRLSAENIRLALRLKREASLQKYSPQMSSKKCVPGSGTWRSNALLQRGGSDTSKHGSLSQLSVESMESEPCDPEIARQVPADGTTNDSLVA